MPRKLKRTPIRSYKDSGTAWCGARPTHKRQNQVATSCKARWNENQQGAQPLRHVLAITKGFRILFHTTLHAFAKTLVTMCSIKSANRFVGALSPLALSTPYVNLHSNTQVTNFNMGGRLQGQCFLAAWNSMSCGACFWLLVSLSPWLDEKLECHVTRSVCAKCSLLGRSLICSEVGKTRWNFLFALG